MLPNGQNRTFFFFFFLIVLYISFKLITPFISIIALALITVLLTKPFYDFLYKKLGRKKSLATGLSMIIVFLIFLVPILFILNISIRQANVFYNEVQEFVKGNNVTYDTVIDKSNEILAKVPFVDYSLTPNNVREVLKDRIEPTVGFLFGNIVNVSGSLANIVLQVVIYFFLLAALYPTLPNLINYIKRISPLDNKIDDMYIRRVSAMATSMVKGTLVIAIVQGVISGILFFLAGVDYVVFWTFLMIFLSIIPLGSGIVSVPVGVFLILTGNVWQGILLIVSHYLIITNVDNFLRPYLVSKEAELHPVLILLGVFGGIKLFGAFGFIYGPAIMILLVTTLEVYNHYYKKHNHT